MKKVRPKRLGDLLNLKRGYDLPESMRNEGSYPVISSAGISGYHSEYRVEGEGVVIGRYGTLGDAHYIEGRYWPHNTSLYVTDFKGNCPRYIYYLLTCIGRIKTSDKSAVPGVNRNELHEMAVPAIDGVHRQKKIAHVLATLDAKIQLNNRINEELEGVAKLLYDYWFVQFDFPITAAQAVAMGKPKLEGKPYCASGGKMIFNKALKRKIPEGWNAKSLSELAGVTKETVNPSDLPDHAFKLFSIPIFDSTGTYSLDGGVEIGSNKFVVTGMDILVSKLNPWFSRVIYTEADIDAVCSTEFVVWQTSASWLKAFLYMVATSPQFICFCTQSATGTSNSHKRVNPEVMMSHSVPWDSSVVKEFGDRVNPILLARQSNQTQNKELTELRDWLLPMLMNGQVTVG